MVMRGRIGVNANDLISASEVAGDPGMNFDLPGQASVEGDAQLAGNDLNDADVSGMTHLLGCEIKGALLGLRTGEVKFGLNFIGTAAGESPARGHAHVSALEEWTRS